MACDLPPAQLTEARNTCNETGAAVDPVIQAARAGCARVLAEYDRMMAAYRACQHPEQASRIKAIIDSAVPKK